MVLGVVVVVVVNKLDVEVVETVKAPGMMGITRLTGLDGESEQFDDVTLLKGFTDWSKGFIETFPLGFANTEGLLESKEELEVFEKA